MTRSLDFDPDKLNWELHEVTPSYRRWIAPLSETHSVMKTEYLADEQLIAENKQMLDDSHGKKFGDGQVVGRIPLNVLYSSQHQIMEKLQEGDRDHLKWWLNSEHALPYRSFRGKV
jgi:hypothetical protein